MGELTSAISGLLGGATEAAVAFGVIAVTIGVIVMVVRKM